MTASRPSRPPLVGITLAFEAHPDGDPLHWHVTTRCPHGTVPAAFAVARRPVILMAAEPLAAAHSVAVACDCGLVDLVIEDDDRPPGDRPGARLRA